MLVGVTGFFALLNLQGAVVNRVIYFFHRPVLVEATVCAVLC